MFNKKLVTVLCHIVALMLIAKIILLITMFIWSYFGVPPVQIFDARITGVVKYLLLLQEIGSSIFFYVALSAAKYLMHCHQCCSMPAPTSPRKPMMMDMPDMPHVALTKKKTTRSSSKTSMEK